MDTFGSSTNKKPWALPIYGWGAVPAEAVPPVIVYPDKRLSEQSDPVTVFDEALQEGAKHLAAALAKRDGYGLAAPQCGVGLRVVVLSPTVLSSQYDTEHSPVALVNPEIVERDARVEMDREGCLSFPGIEVGVRRSVRIQVRAQNTRGEVFEFEAAGLLARVVQHEIDHLNGRLIVDYVVPFRRQMIRKKMLKWLKRHTRFVPKRQLGHSRKRA